MFAHILKSPLTCFRSRSALTCAGLVYALALSAGCQDANSPYKEVHWSTDSESAFGEAATEGKAIVAAFTGSDFCPPCIALEKEVFNTEAFDAWSRENVILLKVDFPRHTRLPSDLMEQNTKLAEKYEISGVPTVLFLNDQGEILGIMGYEPGGAQDWIGRADQIITEARSMGKIGEPQMGTTDETQAMN